MAVRNAGANNVVILGGLAYSSDEGPFTQTVTRRFRLTPKSAGRLTTA